MTLREQAAWWLTEMQEATPEIEQQFSQWLRESPRHVEEYLFVEALWRELDGVDRQHSVDVQQLIADAGGKETIAKVTPFGRVSRLLRAPWSPAMSSRVGRSASWAAVVAGVVVSAFASWMWWPTQETYATTVGEQRAVKLEDGSFVYLNTQSRVEVDYSEHERRVRLLSGEALFTVHHDASRPFRVYSADTVVQAIGTQFNVYRHDDRTTVSVVEGIVAVTDERPGKTVVAAVGETTPDAPGAGPLRITAGEQANVSPAGHIEKRAQGDIEKAVAWRARRLVFRSESLADVAEQFNRYNTIKIRVEGEAVRARKLIGTFNADDPTSLVKFLGGEADLRAQEIGGELVITPR